MTLPGAYGVWLKSNLLDCAATCAGRRPTAHRAPGI